MSFVSIPDHIYKNGVIVFYPGGGKEVDGRWITNHIHGVKLRDVNVGVIYAPDDPILQPYSFDKTYALFQLDNGEQFMEYERKDWQYLTGVWEDDQGCCKRAFYKFYDQVKGTLSGEVKPGLK